MTKSLGLTLYLMTATRSGAPRRAEELPPPPHGRQRVWLHAPHAGEGPPVVSLAWRLHELRHALGIILTHGPGMAAPPPDAVPPGALVHPALPEAPEALRRAVEHWMPDALVLADGRLPPALIHEAGQAGVPVFMVNARAPHVDGSWRTWPGLQRALLRRMRRILARDGAAQASLRRAGAPAARLEAAGALSESPGVLNCNPAERDELARRIGVRPTWLAVVVPEAEEDAVLAAHDAAQKVAHRLLLILVPARAERGEALVAKAAALGLHAARRGAEEEPSDDDQLYVADTEGELGLWYRLAPICFMGGTFSGEAMGRHPFEPGALGSAVLHGARTGRYAGAYDRLARARGARRVEGAATLMEAVVALMAPDRAAVLAQAAWAVATEGAEATDRAAALVLEALDGEEG